MLNIEFAKARMAEVGLSQSDLATQCGVSKEAVSNWFSGESIPRPRRIKSLADALRLEVEELLSPLGRPAPVIAYRTKLNKPASEKALQVAHELASHLEVLVPHLNIGTLFSPPVLAAPSHDEEFIRSAASQTRAKAALSSKAPFARSLLLDLHRQFGSVLVPVMWGEEKIGHENALSVLLPSTKTSFVLLNLNARADDFNYWLSHELAHCYSLHALQGDAGELFAERFAQELLFPYAVAEEAYRDISEAKDPMARAEFYAEAFDISIVTVIRQVDRLAAHRGLELTGLETDDFWRVWNAGRSMVPTVARSLFGTDDLSVEEYVHGCEQEFSTPVFRALAALQAEEGGRSPAYLAQALNINIRDALALSHFLSNRSC